MGHYGFSRASYDEALRGIVNGKYKYLIALIPKGGKPIEGILGQYELFEEFDKEAMKAYAKETAELNSVHEKVEFERIKLFSLEAKALSLVSDIIL